MHGDTPLLCHSLSRTSGLHDLRMGSHSGIMQNALSDCKRLLHYERDYAFCMSSPNQRLREARERAGFPTAVEAADALGIPRSTYIGHENGLRGFPAKRAAQYARRFKVTEEWLLYGKGGAPARVERPEDEAIDIFRATPAHMRSQLLRVMRSFVDDREAGGA